jgi:hypothetical protein
MWFVTILEEKGILFQIAKVKNEIIIDGVVKSQYNVVAWVHQSQLWCLQLKHFYIFIVVAKENNFIHTWYLHI